MSHPNFVSDLVAMAKAFEELPTVTAERDAAKHDVQVGLERIQQLELRLIDRANEIDALNAAVRKAEVERDHAEQMFLETDDRLNAFRGLVQRFRAEVETYDAVADKADALNVKADLPPAEPFRQDYRPTPDVHDHADIPGDNPEDHLFPSERAVEQVSKPIASEDHIDMGLGNVGQSASGEQSNASTEMAVAQPASANETVTPRDTASGDSAGVSVPSDPTPATESSSENVSQGSMPSEAQPSIGDDVGYHNEPKINSSEPGGWEAWDAWANRMNQRYGAGQWPARPSPMQFVAQ